MDTNSYGILCLKFTSSPTQGFMCCRSITPTPRDPAGAAHARPCSVGRASPRARVLLRRGFNPHSRAAQRRVHDVYQQMKERVAFVQAHSTRYRIQQTAHRISFCA